MRDPFGHNQPDNGVQYHGLYKGFVRDNNDPQNRGRIRCYCPQVMGNADNPNNWLGWAETSQPWLGGLSLVSSGPPMTKEQNNGQEVGVWLMFEMGHPDFPVWLGTFTIAPTPEDGPPDLTQTTGAEGGSISADPPPGSNTAAINPPATIYPSNEVRIIAPSGIDIVFLSADGGSLILGPSGVLFNGTFVLANGREIASVATKTSG